MSKQFLSESWDDLSKQTIIPRDSHKSLSDLPQQRISLCYHYVNNYITPRSRVCFSSKISLQLALTDNKA